MSSRPNAGPYAAINNGDMSQASLTSVVSIVGELSMMSYSVSWAGTAPVGTITVQLSNDYSQGGGVKGGVPNAGTWNTITFNSSGSLVTSLPVTGATGTGFIDIPATGAYAMRLIYTKTSGTGVLNVVFNGKVA